MEVKPNVKPKPLQIPKSICAMTLLPPTSSPYNHVGFPGSPYHIMTPHGMVTPSNVLSPLAHLSGIPNSPYQLNPMYAPPVDNQLNAKIHELCLQPCGESNPELTGYPTPVGTTYKWPCGHVFFLSASTTMRMLAGTPCPSCPLTPGSLPYNGSTCFMFPAAPQLHPCTINSPHLIYSPVPQHMASPNVVTTLPMTIPVSISNGNLVPIQTTTSQYTDHATAPVTIAGVPTVAAAVDPTWSAVVANQVPTMESASKDSGVLMRTAQWVNEEHSTIKSPSVDGTGHSDAGLLGSVPSHDDLEKAKESEHKPWMTPRIMNAINARQEAYIKQKEVIKEQDDYLEANGGNEDKYLKEKCQRAAENYRRKRNQVVTLTRLAKKRHAEKLSRHRP